MDSIAGNAVMQATETLDALRAELDATGEPALCMVIADVVEESGGDGRGWRWLGEHGKAPVLTCEGGSWWQFPVGGCTTLPAKVDRRLASNCGSARWSFSTRIAAYEAAETAVREALDAGELTSVPDVGWEQ